jgi:FHA domain
MINKMGTPRAMSRWEPRALLDRALEASRSSFQDGHNGFLLAVVLAGHAPDLGLGLSALSGRDGLPFRTAKHADGIARHSRPGPNVVSDPKTQREPLCVRALLELADVDCYLARIEKRAKEAVFEDRVTVGRARNNDIVLRHGSISKFHASFDLEGERLFIKDAGSRNHTLVNGKSLDARMEIHAGDRIEFGGVDALVCTESALWVALHM